MPHELLGGIHVNDLDAETAGKGRHHLLGFVEAQQTVVDEHTGELIADGPMDQRGGHRGIHTAGQPEDDVVVTDLFANRRDGFFHVVGHVPVVATTADVVNEATYDLLALEGMGHLGVKLHTVETPFFVGHGRDRT